MVSAYTTHYHSLRRPSPSIDMDSEGVSEGMCRSPKRARASPSPRNVHRHAGTPPLRPTQPSSSSLSRSSSYGLTRAGSTSSSSSSAAHGHVPQPQPSSPRPPPPPPLDLPNDEPPQNPQLASPLHWNPPDANPVAHAATSPCRSPRVREKASGWKRSQRRRETWYVTSHATRARVHNG